MLASPSAAREAPGKGIFSPGAQRVLLAGISLFFLSFPLVLSLPGTCRAEYELRLIDGVSLTWQNYTVEGDSYCTQKELGRFCLLKRDVASLRETRETFAAVGRRTDMNRTPVSDPLSRKTVNGISVTGRDLPGADRLDEVMVATMQRIGCTAAALAVAERGAVVYSRGYGWLDRDKRVAAVPDLMIGIASCEKPVTAAAIKQMAAEGRLDLDAKLFDLLKIKPAGPVADDRMQKITIGHLLEHKAGWGPDPVSTAADQLSRTGKAKEPPSIESLLSVIMTGKLKNAPGDVAEYSNFGYDTLRVVLQKVSGRLPGDYFRNVLLQPDRVPGFQDAAAPLRTGAPPLVWNAASGGPISASAPSLLAFMRRYWLTGEPRDNGNPLWVMYGNLDGSTALMVWRPDGIDLVALFNGRGNASHDEISRNLQTVIEQQKERQGGSLLTR